jgi:hypothetical protein
VWGRPWSEALKITGRIHEMMLEYGRK